MENIIDINVKYKSKLRDQFVLPVNVMGERKGAGLLKLINNSNCVTATPNYTETKYVSVTIGR